MSSDKTLVIEHLFKKRWDAKNQRLRRTLVTQDDVVDAISFCNEQDGKGRSARNPANFMKDVVRGINASKHWPQLLGPPNHGGAAFG